MNWMCDVYAYADMEGGWTVHVAKLGRLFPPVPSFPVHWRISLAIHRWSGVVLKPGRAAEYPVWWRGVVARAFWAVVTFWNVHLHERSLDAIPLRPIGLPYDGDTIWCATAGECADVLQRLSDTGYRVPRSAIRALIEEEAASGGEEDDHG